MSKRFDFGEEEKPDNQHLSHFHQFGQIDLASVGPALGIGTTNAAAGYLFESDFSKKRSFTEEACFYTGTAYLTGVVTGGTFGFFEGMKKAREIDTTVRKLKVNAVLNGISRRGPTLGSNFGVLALMFSSFEKTTEYFRDKDDLVNPTVGGFLTGMLFKSTAGIRPMFAWSIVGGVSMFLVHAYSQRDELKEKMMQKEWYQKWFPEKVE